LKEYIARSKPIAYESATTADDLHRAFDGLLLNKGMLDRLGPAINSGGGCSCFGPPGNGKTCIAERITATFGHEIWIPRAIGVTARYPPYDPMNHEESRCRRHGVFDPRKIDKRWIRIRRPHSCRGELTMSQLEVTINTSTGISESPLH